MIKIKCKGNSTAKLNELTVIQGNLKELSQVSLDKLQDQIIKEGFIVPFFIWKNKGNKNILDGTQRYRVLTDLAKKKKEINDIQFPTISIDAKNKKEAFKRILAISSQYGQLTTDGLYEFINEAGIEKEELDGFEFDAFDIEDFNAEFFEEEPDKPDNKNNNNSETKAKCPKCGYEITKIDS